MSAKAANTVPTQEDYEALAELRYALRKFTDFSISEVLKLGLTPPQHQALLAIKGLPVGRQMTAGMLADRLLISLQSASELISGLAEAGYVDFVPDVKNSRRQVVHLLDKADFTLEKLGGTHLLEIREMAPELVYALRMLQDRRRLEKVAWLS